MLVQPLRLRWYHLQIMKNNIIKNFLHTRIRVDDLERTVSFYIKVFGFKVIERKKSPRGSELVFLQIPNSEVLIEVAYFPDSGSVRVQEDLMHFAFEVHSMEAFSKHLQNLNLSFSEEPCKSSSGSQFAFIDAPEGYEIELIERPR